MSLKSEMIKHSWDEIENIIDINKAIEIAEEYAKEMCSKQRLLCYAIINEQLKLDTQLIINWSKIPLATEVK